MRSMPGYIKLWIQVYNCNFQFWMSPQHYVVLNFVHVIVNAVKFFIYAYILVLMYWRFPRNLLAVSYLCHLCDFKSPGSNEVISARRFEILGVEMIAGSHYINDNNNCSNEGILNEKWIQQSSIVVWILSSILALFTSVLAWISRCIVCLN